MLQNRWGEREFPVRDRWEYAGLVRAAAKQRAPQRAALRGLLQIAPAMVVLLVFGSSLLPGRAGGATDANGVPFPVALGLFVLAAAAGLLVGVLVDRSLPRREQQRYRRLTGATGITERQQQLLALDAVSDWATGSWNSSLDHSPAWRTLPPEVRRRHEQGDGRSPFTTMPLPSVAALRARLDADHRIASGADLALFVADAQGEQGLSARFHRTLHGPDGDRVVARLASLTGEDEWDLRALDQPVDGLPARLLHASDAQRLITIVRNAYLAEHVDEATAWRLIERAAEPAASLHADWDDYWRHVRIGLALTTDDLDVVQRFDEAREGLRASGWPAARVAFPAGAVPERLRASGG